MGDSPLTLILLAVLTVIVTALLIYFWNQTRNKGGGHTGSADDTPTPTPLEPATSPHGDKPATSPHGDKPPVTHPPYNIFLDSPVTEPQCWTQMGSDYATNVGTNGACDPLTLDYDLVGMCYTDEGGVSADGCLSGDNYDSATCPTDTLYAGKCRVDPPLKARQAPNLYPLRPGPENITDDPWIDCDSGPCGERHCYAGLTSFSSYPFCCDRNKYKGATVNDGFRYKGAPYRIPSYPHNECDYDPCETNSGNLSYGLVVNGKNICGNSETGRPCTYQEVAKEGRYIAGLIHDFEKWPNFRLGDTANRVYNMKVIDGLGNVQQKSHPVQIVDSSCNVDTVTKKCKNRPPNSAAAKNSPFDVDIEFWSGTQMFKGVPHVYFGGEDESNYMSEDVYQANKAKNTLFAEYTKKGSSDDPIYKKNQWYLPDISDGIKPDATAGHICIERPSYAIEARAAQRT
uniref:Uncharacterized protein n=1 Tax=viral metagenome TaxID=1070528 RepID=A0A6C0BYX8_9ZZZZ